MLYAGTPISLTDYHHQQQLLVKSFTSFISVKHFSPIVMTKSDHSDVRLGVSLLFTREEIECEMGYERRHT